MTTATDDSDASVTAEARWAISEATSMISTIGPRAPGSQGELSAQLHLASLLKSIRPPSASINDPCVSLESFVIHPLAFFAFVQICLSCSLLSLLPLPTILRVLLSHLPFAVLSLELLSYRKFLDPLFPPKDSVNLLCSFAPTSPGTRPRRRVVLVGHADAAFEWTYNRLPGLLWVAFSVETVGAVCAVMRAWFSTFRCAGVTVVVCVAFLVAMFHTNFCVVAPGANDNLSGSLSCVSVARLLVGRLANTELTVLITGAEEAGIRGAMDFVQRHCEELARDCDEIAVLVVDTLGELEWLSIIDSDMNGLVKMDRRVVSLLSSSCKRVLGHDVRRQTVFLGATDGAAFGKAGIPCASLEAMSPYGPRYYHTRGDTAKAMSEECLAATIAVLRDAILTFDSDGLPPAT